MHFQIRKCKKCGNYTLKDKCKKCGNSSISVHPAKFSPDDKYLKYRIIGKTDIIEGQNSY